MVNQINADSGILTSVFVNYKFLVAEGIIPNRTTLARSIAQFGFPKPVELGQNRLAWDFDEIQVWLASRPRRTPKYAGASVPEARDNP